MRILHTHSSLRAKVAARASSFAQVMNLLMMKSKVFQLQFGNNQKVISEKFSENQNELDQFDTLRIDYNRQSMAKSIELSEKN